MVMRKLVVVIAALVMFVVCGGDVNDESDAGGGDCDAGGNGKCDGCVDWYCNGTAYT